MVMAGDKALDFRLKDTDGREVGLSDFKGKRIVLYFYPEDDTPGCTVEACSFRDIYDDILEAGAVVIGISPDGERSHKKFRDKYNLPFYLLCDEEHKVTEDYGVWGEKQMFGRTYMGVIRSTFIIGEDLTILKAYPKVTPEGHGEQILKDLMEG